MEHDTESIFEIVKRIGLQHKRDILEIDAANAILKANWIDNVDDFEEFTAEEGNQILRIPVKLYHLIKQYIEEKGKLSSTFGKNGIQFVKDALSCFVSSLDYFLLY
jgi:hypothetical protein